MKLVLLDRDGVINEDSDQYIRSVADWKPIPGSIEAIARLSQHGYRVFVASNQSGIGRGYTRYDALMAIHALLQKQCQEAGGRIDGIAFAPDHPDRATPLRKPAPGMLLDIAQRLGVSLEGVPFVGDKLEDVQAARAAGASPVLVRSGKPLKAHPETEGVPVFDNLAAFVHQFLGPPTLRVAV